jgi:5-methylphenazine-1-carboxylate 1-monooxygenase
MKIAIAGAGIAGLASALSLHAAGFTEIAVYDSVRRLMPLGVGINLLPHAVRELTELSLADRLSEIGVETSTLAYFNHLGQSIWVETRGRSAGYLWPQYSVHRGELQQLLADEVRSRLGSSTIVLGERAVRATDDIERGAALTLRSATGRRHDEHVDVVIAADGIRSAIRAERNPGEGEPIWNHLVLWRGTALAPPYLDGRSMIMAGHENQKFVAYPLSLAADGSGLVRINFIAERRVDDTFAEFGDWDRSVAPETIARQFEEWSFDWLDIPRLIRSATEVLEYPMVDRDPLPEWSTRAVTLVGDAAHAMYPIGSNGASQAVLDARTLARALVSESSVSDALAAYEEQRRPLTTSVLLSNRTLGPERVMYLAHQRAPAGFGDIEDVVPIEERRAIAAQYKNAAGFDPDALNARPSLSAVHAHK